MFRGPDARETEYEIAWMHVRFGITSGEALPHFDGRARIDGLPLSFDITTTLQKQLLCGVIPRLRIPGTVPGGYPEDTRSVQIR